MSLSVSLHLYSNCPVIKNILKPKNTQIYNLLDTWMVSACTPKAHGSVF